MGAPQMLNNEAMEVRAVRRYTIAIAAALLIPTRFADAQNAPPSQDPYGLGTSSELAAGINAKYNFFRVHETFLRQIRPSLFGGYP